jgi:hypothetical protein
MRRASPIRGPREARRSGMIATFLAHMGEAVHRHGGRLLNADSPHGSGVNSLKGR